MTDHFAEAFKPSRQRGAERLVAGSGPAANDNDRSTPWLDATLPGV